MKIAVPVADDRESVFQKTGHAPYFAVYENEQFFGFVENAHGKGGHGDHEDVHHHEGSFEEHVAHHKKDLSDLAGCDVMLVQMIGEHMREAVESLGIKIKKIRKKDGNTSDEVIQNFLNNNL